MYHRKIVHQVGYLPELMARNLIPLLTTQSHTTIM